jgi:hypothetical protein
MYFSVYLSRCIEHPSVGAVGALPHYRGIGAIARNYVRDTSYGLETTRNTKVAANGCCRFQWRCPASAPALLR